MTFKLAELLWLSTIMCKLVPFVIWDKAMFFFSITVYTLKVSVCVDFGVQCFDLLCSTFYVI
jgi:hypothetical protein